MTLFARLRRWGEGYTSDGRFSPVGVVFHWGMAALILFQLGLGWAMTLLVPVGGSKLHWYEVHSAVGLAIFLLALFRIVWRIMISDPWNDADTMGWRTKLAYVVEHLFYVTFFILPITGWAMWSSVAPPGPLSVGGIFPWPQLPIEELSTDLQWQVMAVAESLHLFFVWVLMLLIPMHVLAALKHHFWDRSDVLRGMLPDIPDWKDPRASGMHTPQGRQSPKESEAG